jgi:hypothetical protein
LLDSKRIIQDNTNGKLFVLNAEGCDVQGTRTALETTLLASEVLHVFEAGCPPGDEMFALMSSTAVLFFWDEDNRCLELPLPGKDEDGKIAAGATNFRADCYVEEDILVWAVQIDSSLILWVSHPEGVQRKELLIGADQQFVSLDLEQDALCVTLEDAVKKREYLSLNAASLEPGVLDRKFESEKKHEFEAIYGDNGGLIGMNITFTLTFAKESTK